MGSSCCVVTEDAGLALSTPTHAACVCRSSCCCCLQRLAIMVPDPDISLSYCVYCNSQLLSPTTADALAFKQNGLIRVGRKTRDELSCCSTCPAAVHDACYKAYTGQQVWMMGAEQNTGLEDVVQGGSGKGLWLQMCVTLVPWSSSEDCAGATSRTFSSRSCQVDLSCTCSVKSA